MPLYLKLFVFLILTFSGREEFLKIFKKVRTLDFWTIKIEESIFDPSFGVIERKKGVFSFQRPLTFSLEYENGLRIAGDGEKVWFFDPLKKRVYVQPITAVFKKNFVLALILGDETIFDVFDIKRLGENELLLVPKDGGVVRKIKIYLRSKGFFPLKKIVVWAERYEVRVRITFFSTKKLKEIDFVVPKGWEMIEF